VADRHRERIGRVGRKLHLYRQQMPDHVVDLGFLGAAYSNYRKLDRARRVLVHTERNGHGSQRRAPRLAELEGTVGILGEEHSFDSDFLRTMLGDQFRDSGVDDAQAIREGPAGGGNAALRDQHRGAIHAIDDAEARAKAARIESQNALATARQHPRDGGACRPFFRPECTP
jgi:hypothetical protein